MSMPMIVAVLENDFFGFKWLTEEFKITIKMKSKKKYLLPFSHAEMNQMNSISFNFLHCQ